MRSWISLTYDKSNNDSILLNDDEFKNIVGTNVFQFKGVVDIFPPSQDDYYNGDIIMHRYIAKEENKDIIHEDLYIYIGEEWFRIEDQPAKLTKINNNT